ncbi:hypothetical protein P3L10_012370 [Capsicum annuum]
MYIFLINVVSRFGLFGKQVNLRGDHSNGLIDNFASISSTEPKGNFDHSTLASEGGFTSLEICHAGYLY